jgi:glucuronate isomerase
MIYKFGMMDYEKEWARQFHMCALRNNNSKMMRVLGLDTGFDSISDFEIARPLAKFFDKLDTENRTILYNLNPRDNELIATLIKNSQDGSIAGKLQYGLSWWSLDQRDDIQK